MLTLPRSHSSRLCHSLSHGRRQRSHDGPSSTATPLAQGRPRRGHRRTRRRLAAELEEAVRSQADVPVSQLSALWTLLALVADDQSAEGSSCVLDLRRLTDSLTSTSRAIFTVRAANALERGGAQQARRQRTLLSASESDKAFMAKVDEAKREADAESATVDRVLAQ